MRRKYALCRGGLSVERHRGLNGRCGAITTSPASSTDCVSLLSNLSYSATTLSPSGAFAFGWKSGENDGVSAAGSGGENSGPKLGYENVTRQRLWAIQHGH